jgi:dolichol-phosphate mannosyltransferase
VVETRSPQRAAVILPTYNERETLPAVLRQLAGAASHAGLACDAVVVDDNSPDGTGEVAGRIATELADALPVTVVVRPRKAGLTSAVLDGVRRSRADIIVVMDSDLSHPPDVVPALIRAVAGGADLAVGSRYAPGGGVAGWPAWRRALSWGATRLSRVLLGVRVRDPVSGFFAVRRSTFESVRFEGTGYKLLLEILASGRTRKVEEVPYRFTDRAKGRSKLGAGEIVHFVRLVGRLWRTRIAQRGRWTVP